MSSRLWSVNYTHIIPVKKQLEPRLPLLPPSWNKVRDLGSNVSWGILIPSESLGLGVPSLRWGVGQRPLKFRSELGKKK